MIFNSVTVTLFIILSSSLNIVAELSDETENGTMTFEEQVAEANKPWKQQNHGTILTMLDMDFLTELDNASRSATLSPKQTRILSRGEYHCLLPSERSQLHHCAQQMKSTMAGENSEYDTFVLHHDGSRSPAAHAGPSFVIWHRMFLFLMEKALQKYSSNVSLPYLDNRLLRRAPGSPRHSVLFSPDLAGSAVGVVRTGPFVNWTINSDACKRISRKLARNVSISKSYLYNESFPNILLSFKKFQDLCYPWNKFFEEWHGKIHVFVGGMMRQVMCAPFDPLFFFHHTFVDYLFEEFVRKPSISRNQTLAYPNFTDFALDKYFSAAYRMLPFGIRNNQMLNSTKFVPKYYKSPGDVVCVVDADCCPNKNSLYVWCDVAVGQCVSKLVEGSPVETDFPQACYCANGEAVIRDGVCGCS